MSQSFKKKKEDFTCQNCGYKVKGTGFTNHCPKCLWSRHVDINPGDRAETCRGMMEPVGLELKDGEQVLIHRCLKCKFERKNKVVTEDNFDEVLKISQMMK